MNDSTNHLVASCAKRLKLPACTCTKVEAGEMLTMQNYFRQEGGREERNGNKQQQKNKERTKAIDASLKPKRISEGLNEEMPYFARPTIS